MIATASAAPMILRMAYSLLGDTACHDLNTATSAVMPAEIAASRAEGLPLAQVVQNAAMTTAAAVSPAMVLGPTFGITTPSPARNPWVRPVAAQ